MRYFPVVIIIVVVVAVAGGFFFIGSPREERARRFDERRVNDLQTLQSEIINYWRLKNVLPQNLDALKDDIRGFRSPQDPETGAAYHYAIKSPSSFELCVLFNRASGENNIGAPKSIEPYGKNWEHAAGRVCFTRTIDKDFYPSSSRQSSLKRAKASFASFGSATA